MVRDEMKGNPPLDQDVQDDHFYDENPPQDGGEALEEDPAQWEQPTDDYVEEEEQGTEPQEAAAPEDDMYAEGPAEEEYVQQLPEEQDDYGAHEGEDMPGQVRRAAEKKKNFGFGSGHQEATPALGNVASPLMRYLPYIGAGAAALVLGFFGFQQLKDSFVQSPSATDPMQIAEATPPTEAPPPNQAPPQKWDAQPAPSNTSQAAQMLGLGSAPASDSNAQANNVPPPAGNVAPPASNEPIVPFQNQGGMPSQRTVEMENKIAELNQQIAQMKVTQNDLEQKLQAAQAAPPAPTEDSAKKALEDRIAQLEQKLSAANAAVASRPALTASEDVPLPSRSSKVRRAKQESASTDFLAAKTQRKKSAAHASTKKRESRRDVENAGSYHSISWVLRSATPGAAWLSQGPYSSDLRRVVPGDKVPGLGTITSIRQVAGRWLVEGTQGSVR